MSEVKADDNYVYWHQLAVSGALAPKFNPDSSNYNKFEKGQCTWYAYGRERERAGRTITFSSAGDLNAVQWLDKATNCSTISVNSPARGDVAIWSGTIPGHVAYVEAVFGDVIFISEANWDLQPYDPNPATDGKVRELTKEEMSQRGTSTIYTLEAYLRCNG